MVLSLSELKDNQWLHDREREAVSNRGNYLALLVLPLFQPSVAVTLCLLRQLTLKDSVWGNTTVINFNVYCDTYFILGYMTEIITPRKSFNINVHCDVC